MSLPETCPFCGAAVSVDDDGKKRVAHLVVIFACGTGFHELIDSRKTQSRECKEREMQARIAALEAEAKQAREDEAWALDAAVTIHPDGASKSFAPMFWSVRYWDGVRTLEVTAPTIHAALRPLRAKVEGGAR